MQKFFRGGGDFGEPVTEGGATQKRLGTTAVETVKIVVLLTNHLEMTVFYFLEDLM